MSSQVTTDAASGSTLSGSNWLSRLLETGIAGYVAVEAVRNQRREPGAVVTADPPRVTSPAPASGFDSKTLWWAGGIIAAAVVLTLLIRRK